MYETNIQKDSHEQVHYTVCDTHSEKMAGTDKDINTSLGQ